MLSFFIKKAVFHVFHIENSLFSDNYLYISENVCSLFLSGINQIFNVKLFRFPIPTRSVASQVLPTNKMALVRSL